MNLIGFILISSQLGCRSFDQASALFLKSHLKSLE